MPPVAAGCLVTREVDGRIEVLLVHARRASFQRPLFGIPKGLVENDEELEACASRETLEETGLRVQIRGALGSVRQKSGKVVHAFWATVDSASEAAIDDARPLPRARSGKRCVPVLSARKGVRANDPGATRVPRPTQAVLSPEC